MSSINQHPLLQVRVILRVANSGVIDEKKGSFFKMDQKKKQVTLLEPDSRERTETTGVDGKEEDESSKRRVDVSAPKMFAKKPLVEQR